MVDEFEDDDFDAQFEDNDENSEEPDFEEEDSVEEDSFEEEPEDEFEEEETYDSSGDSEDSGEDEDQDFDKPVSEGEVVEVEIDDLGSKGDGIARVEGFVVFVPGGEVGESYDVEITSVGNKFAFGEITE
jgi:predicted RNA-binding protein with TRAM domain